MYHFVAPPKKITINDQFTATNWCCLPKNYVLRGETSKGAFLTLHHLTKMMEYKNNPERENRLKL